MEHIIELKEREVKEIHLALLYASDFNHGTSGHLAYCTIAALAYEVGFFLNEDGTLNVPDAVRIEESKHA